MESVDYQNGWKEKKKNRKKTRKGKRKLENKGNEK